MLGHGVDARQQAGGSEVERLAERPDVGWGRDGDDPDGNGGGTGGGGHEAEQSIALGLRLAFGLALDVDVEVLRFGRGGNGAATGFVDGADVGFGIKLRFVEFGVDGDALAAQRPGDGEPGFGVGLRGRKGPIDGDFAGDADGELDGNAGVVLDHEVAADAESGFRNFARVGVGAGVDGEDVDSAAQVRDLVHELGRAGTDRGLECLLHAVDREPVAAEPGAGGTRRSDQ